MKQSVCVCVCVHASYLDGDVRGPLWSSSRKILEEGACFVCAQCVVNPPFFSPDTLGKVGWIPSLCGYDMITSKMKRGVCVSNPTIGGREGGHIHANTHHVTSKQPKHTHPNVLWQYCMADGNRRVHLPGPVDIIFTRRSKATTLLMLSVYCNRNHSLNAARCRCRCPCPCRACHIRCSCARPSWRSRRRCRCTTPR